MEATSLDTLVSVLHSLREKLDNEETPYEIKNLNTKYDATAERDNLQYVKKKIKEDFLRPTNVLSWELLDLVQNVPTSNTTELNIDGNHNSYDYKSFLNVSDFVLKSDFNLEREGLLGRVTSFREGVSLKEVESANSSNSLSLTREIDHKGNMVRGSLQQLPFLPGGIATQGTQANTTAQTATSMKLLHKDDLGLFDIPDGMKRGIIPQIHKYLSSKTEEHKLQDLEKSVVTMENDNIEVSYKPDDVQETEPGNKESFALMNREPCLNEPTKEYSDLGDIDDILPVGIEFGRSTGPSKSLLVTKEWAHVVNLNHKIENFEELVPNPARSWPFNLDPFQKEAIYHMEQGDSVFVAAHTSAGKTVVAEYAIAMSKRNMTKTIYTSPIKALSNQKFRDFKETFKDLDVGLLTGDVQINPDADCLIMTTEILRSMLYRGADLIRDVEFVIFDEVHYVNDQDRGVVWEEVIIMLPQHVKFVLLSATVPNTYEFANWVGRTKQKDIYVISTPQRPVPLEINIWTKNQLIPVITPKREFLSANFRKHKEILDGASQPTSATRTNSSQGKGSSTRGGSTRGGSTRGGASKPGATRGALRGSRGSGAIGSNKKQFYRRGGPSKKTWPELVNFLRSKNLLPMVVFVFSKKRCEEYADMLEGITFTTNKEKSQIYMFIEKSITRLKKEDRELPQIQKVRMLLERGIAVHHGGLLPIVKELIEILFAKGFVKVLFATETFAMGLNLPTRTVVFSEIQKHDGNGLRDLTPGEFTQMAGRAGRRGLDDTGTVIVMSYNEPLPIVTFKEVTLGVPTKLQSQFRLTYNMILNLLRIEALKVEEMIKYSFGENIKQVLQPENEKEIKSLKKELDTIEYHECQICDKDIDELLTLTNEWNECNSRLLQEIMKTDAAYRVMRVGRVIVFRDKVGSIRLGFLFRNEAKDKMIIVLAFTKPSVLENLAPNHLPYLPENPTYIVNNFSKFEKCDLEPMEVPLGSVELITAYKLKTSLNAVLEKDNEALASFKDEVGLLIRISKKFKQGDLGRSLKVHQINQERLNIITKIENLNSFKCPELAHHFEPKYKSYQIQAHIKELYHAISDQNLSLLPDYEKRLKVLMTAGFIDVNQNVLLKGRVACEINSGYELVITELILDNFLGDFEPEEIVALLSVFVYEGRTNEEEAPIITPRLAKGKARIQEIYQRMLDVFQEHQVPLTQEEAEFLEKKRFAFMNVVYEWARGMSFSEIMSISPEAEGTVVRVITWLDEICRQVKTASIIIGNNDLHMKMNSAQELIKRDIVFAASLYL